MTAIASFSEAEAWRRSHRCATCGGRLWIDENDVRRGEHDIVCLSCGRVVATLRRSGFSALERYHESVNA